MQKIFKRDLREKNLTAKVNHAKVITVMHYDEEVFSLISMDYLDKLLKNQKRGSKS